MNSSDYTNNSSSSDFHLPDEILSVMPTDPYEQLDLARKITSMAIASRVSKLESEAGRLRQKLGEKDRVIFELEEKVSELEIGVRDADNRLRVALDENSMLSRERDTLMMTTKKLNRDLSKLETFKRHLMQSLSDDNLSQQETVDIGTCDQSVVSAYTVKDETPKIYQSSHINSDIVKKENQLEDESRNVGQRFSMTPYITPRLTPTETPRTMSLGGSPRRYSAAGSPKMTSGATSPKHRYEGQTAFSSWYSQSQQSSAASSPPRGRPLPVLARTPQMHGKEFFRQARNRLSYEQFSAFLANIKELNAQKQSREETLRKAEDIFGSANKDLYLSFQGLLNRNSN